MFVIRHRFIIQDLTLLAAMIAVAALVLYQVDVFASGPTPAGNTIEADEVPILAAILCVGLLMFAWRRSREQKRETQRRVAAEQSARELAMEDPLTGLPNRRQFVDSLNAAIAAPPRAGAAHALLMLDLNRFKQVNDVYGHSAGDQALIVVGQRLAAVLRLGDLVARLGGDEFVILARDLAGPEAATSIALRAIDALSIPVPTGNVVHNLGVGIGVAMFPFPGATAEEVMRRADVALYKAKAVEKSSLRFFDSEMDRHVRERAVLERELRAAIAAGDIQPFFQPLVDLKTQKVVGFEALARWTHKTLGEIPPERFIPIAEDTGLIYDLADRLLRQACRAARAWPDHVTLAFNISPVQLKDPGLGLRILGILGETGLRTGRLEIEITESALVKDMEAAKQVLGSLRLAGVRIVLDDFGTGYSSLYHLRNFKIDKIKIDRSFVERMGDERESAEIVNALIGLGHGLGLAITAEGIEQNAQGRDLLAQGCEQGQGVLFSRAVPAAETATFFAPVDGVRSAGAWQPSRNEPCPGFRL
jgi:diguanylate cyclase (GGDEF)-like protein